MTATAEAIARVRAGGLREGARATFWLGMRQVRNVLREPAGYIPAMLIPLFFYFVQSASLSRLAEGSGQVADYEPFVLPVSILFAVSNEAAGLGMVLDIQRGYFDKLLLAPVSRLSIVLGAMGANFARVVFQALVVTLFALALGLDFRTGIVGAVGMVALASIWGIAFGAVGIGTALKTGSEQATQAAQIVLFPMLFLTTSFAPREAMTGWLRTAVVYNPITYLLEGMRGFSLTGDAGDIVIGFVSMLVLAAATVSFALWGLRARLR